MFAYDTCTKITKFYLLSGTYNDARSSPHYIASIYSEGKVKALNPQIKLLHNRDCIFCTMKDFLFYHFLSQIANELVYDAVVISFYVKSLLKQHKNIWKKALSDKVFWNGASFFLTGRIKEECVLILHLFDLPIALKVYVTMLMQSVSRLLSAVELGSCKFAVTFSVHLFHLHGDMWLKLIFCYNLALVSFRRLFECLTLESKEVETPFYYIM